MSGISDSAVEFWVLLRRALDEGYLDIDELLTSYTGLAPSIHPRLADDRHVDLEAVVEALNTLPANLLDSAQVLVVPDLSGFVHTPVGPGAGVLDDGTLIIAAPLGPASVAELAARLCLLEHEAAKARDLLPEQLQEEFDDDGDDSEAGIADELLGQEQEPVSVLQPEDDEDEASDPLGATVMDLDPAETDTEFAPEPVAAENEPDLLSHVAFAWGTDPMTLAGANEATNQALLRLLAVGEALPPVYLHASLGADERRRRGERTGERIASLLAESGYLSRPLHLWVGPGAVTDCLSPYARDLREALRAWAQQEAGEPHSALGEDLDQPSMQPGEDELYAIAHDFLRSDSRLPQERETAERTVGLTRHDVDGVSLETIDLARVDLDLCDARLNVGAIVNPAPVLVRLDADLGDPDAFLLRTLLDTLGPAIASITIVLEGSLLRGAPGSVLLPHLLIRWAGEQKLAPPATAPFDPEELNGYANGPLQRGAVISVPSAALLSRKHVDEVRQRFDAAAIDVGGDGMIDALNDALWAGTLGSEPCAGWVLVGTQRVSTGRLSVASQSGASAVAIARLRALLAPPPAPPTQTRQPPRPSGHRAIRIKA